jgi:hypothetical protein
MQALHKTALFGRDMQAPACVKSVNQCAGTANPILNAAL